MYQFRDWKLGGPVQNGQCWPKKLLHDVVAVTAASLAACFQANETVIFIEDVHCLAQEKNHGLKQTL